MGEGRTGRNQVPEMDLADHVNLIICSACISPHLLTRKNSITMLMLKEMEILD